MELDGSSSTKTVLERRPCALASPEFPRLCSFILFEKNKEKRKPRFKSKTEEDTHAWFSLLDLKSILSLDLPTVHRKVHVSRKRSAVSRNAARQVQQPQAWDGGAGLVKTQKTEAER